MTRASLLVTALLVLGCGASAPAPGAAEDAGLAPDAGLDDAGAVDAGAEVDAGPLPTAPTRWPADPAPVTHDVDRSLPAVLETAQLAGACDAVRAGNADRATRLRCGKWMFFYETFGTVGVPVPLLDFLQKHYADTYYGPGFERLGFVADPANMKGMPLGLSPTTGKSGSVETRAFTCAACHFGKMPDGRYAVGYGNLNLDYGRFIASLGAPLSLSFNANDPKVHETLRQELAGPVAQAKAKAGYTTEAGLVGLQLLGAGSGGSLTIEEQGRFLGLQTGTMDFLTKPLVDDGVWTVSRILPLWNLPEGLPHEWLSWNGGVPSLENFLEGFVVIGVGAADWPPARLAPLAEYVRTLRTPPLESAPPEVAAGAALFVEKGCLTCHDGPSGESRRVFTFAELGTDAAYATIYNPGPDGAPCCGLGGGASYVTRGVKAPRMTGVAWQTRFLHNGAVEDLEALFCLTPRPVVTTLAQTAGGHDMTCEGLTVPQKQQLIDYLRSL